MVKWFKSLFKHKETWNNGKVPHWRIRNNKLYWYSPEEKIVKVKRDKLGRFK
jgi:hypothetical protein